MLNLYHLNLKVFESVPYIEIYYEGVKFITCYSVYIDSFVILCSNWIAFPLKAQIRLSYFYWVNLATFKFAVI